MSLQITSIIAAIEKWEIEKNYQFYLFLFSLFVVCMGLFRWLGRRTWLQWEKSRREEAGLPVALLMSQDGGAEQSWTYSALYQGGLLGVSLVASNLVFVVFMMIPQRSVEDAVSALPILMGVPIFSTVFGIFQIIRTERGLRFVKNSPGVIVIAVASLSTWIVGVTRDIEPLYIIAIDTLVIAVLSFCLSYALGMTEGLRIADPALNYPLVTVATRDGETLDRAWLYERTDSDYRLVTESGSNHIVPAANVKEITGPIEFSTEGGLAGQGRLSASSSVNRPTKTP
jgi:hypothetical protein